MEDNLSKALYKLNEDYIKIYYSKEYQKSIRKKHRKIGARDIIKYIMNGYIFDRIKSIYKTNNYNTNQENKTQDKNKDLKEKKIAIYSVVAGKYDSIKEPLYCNEICEYYMITDQDIDENSKWKKIDINSIKEIKDKSNLEKARYLKTHPHIIFPEYDYTIWVDGNILIVADLFPILEEMGDKLMAIHNHPNRKCIYNEGKTIVALNKAKKNEVQKQLKHYKSEGFPKEYGLFETNVIATKISEDMCMKIMEEWWSEMEKFTKRDQLSFTYVLWKNNLQCDFIKLIGDNTRMNPRFRVSAHK